MPIPNKFKVKKPTPIQKVLRELVDSYQIRQDECAAIAGVACSTISHAINHPDSDMHYQNAMPLVQLLESMKASKRVRK